MGYFSSLEVQSGSEGGYELAGVFHHGSYGNISETLEDMGAIADVNGFDTYNMVSIYFNDPNVVPTDSLRTFVGGVVRDSSEIVALDLPEISRISLPEGEAVYSYFEYVNKMSYMVGHIVNYPPLFEVSTANGWEDVIGFGFFKRDYTRYVLLRGNVNELEVIE